MPQSAAAARFFEMFLWVSGGAARELSRQRRRLNIFKIFSDVGGGAAETFQHRQRRLRFCGAFLLCQLIFEKL